MPTQRITDFARGASVPAATLNAMQDRAVGLRPASTAAAASGSLALYGRDGIYWPTPDGGVADGAIAVVDASRDWKHHHLQATFIRLTADAQRLHGADAWKRNDPAQPLVVRVIEDAWTGANTAAITAGTAPVIGPGVFAVILDELSDGADRIFLYARSSDGALCLYNDSGSTLRAELFFGGAGAGTSSGGTSEVPGFSTADAATADATWTTIVTLSLGTRTSVVLAAAITAITADGGDGGGWTFAVRARRGGSGSASVGTAVFTLAEFDGTGWDVRVQASGSGVVVQVHGEAATDITWRAEIQATAARPA